MAVDKSKAREMVASFMEKGILLSPELIESSIPEDMLSPSSAPDSLAVLNPDIIGLLEKDVDFAEVDRFKVIAEKRKNAAPYKEMLDSISESISKADSMNAASTSAGVGDNVRILFNYDRKTKKKEIQDFVKYYNARYRALESMLSARQDLSGLTSIARVLAKNARENVSVIGLVKEITQTGNNNIMITLEDPTSEIKVLVSKSKPDLHELAKDIVLDEVIGICGVSGDKIIFCSSIVLPDVPAHKELKKAPNECYALFLSDLHFGSNTFLPDEFNRFIRWVNGEIGSDAQKEVVKKIRYIFIAGDLVDGVGIYPGQDAELVIKDICEQYKECAKLLSKIPKHIQIIVCPGNHDSSRLSEPQPPLSRDFIKPLLDMPNLMMLSNPCMVNIESSEDFPGFDILMYHGYSFDYFVANVDSIRNSGGYDRADLIMKFLLQRRHLGPTHNATLHEPDTETDPLVIGRVPDFFVSGHIHKVAVSSYRGVSLICGSCWQSTTSFQEKMGHHPEPARVPMVNLQTRETKILRF